MPICCAKSAKTAGCRVEVELHRSPFVLTMVSKGKNQKKVVVCGITGSQGGWVFDALKKNDAFEVIGFSRNVPLAQAKLGCQVQLVAADLVDLSSLQRVFQGADYVFGMTQPWNKDYTHADVQAEVLQGKNIVQACLDCHVKHLVFSSAASDGVESGLRHVDSKIQIENYIKESGMNYTILHPVQYADNVGLPFLPVQANGWIRGFVDADAKVPYVSCRDIGLVTEVVLKDPLAYNKQTIKVIGDIVSGDELAQMMSHLRSGETFRYYSIPRFLIRLFSKEFYLMRLFFEEFGRNPQALAEARKDIDDLRKMVPELSTMQQHLEREGWATRELGEPQGEQRRGRIVLGAILVVGVAIAVAVTRNKK